MQSPSRHSSSSIKIADGITVTLNRIEGTRLHLGDDALSDMRIVRSELKLFSPYEADAAKRRQEEAA